MKLDNYRKGKKGILSRHQQLLRMTITVTIKTQCSSTSSSLLGTIPLAGLSLQLHNRPNCYTEGRKESQLLEYKLQNNQLVSRGEKTLQRQWREQLWNSNNCTEALGQLSGKRSNMYTGSNTIHYSSSQSFSLLGNIHSQFIFFTFPPSFYLHQFITHN